MTEKTPLPADIAAIRDAVASGPKAWMRRWFFDGENPAKVRNENGRQAWPAKFKFLPVTAGQVLPDDVALIACHPESIARLLDALESAQAAVAWVPKSTAAIDALRDEVESMRVELDQAQKDASRYQALRATLDRSKRHHSAMPLVLCAFPPGATFNSPERLDAAIDAAMEDKP